MEYTSQGQGTLNTVLGAVGTAGTVFGGGLGNLFGGATGGNQNVTQGLMDIIDLKTENAILKAKIDISDKISALESKVDSVAASQAVINCGYQSAISVLQTQMNQILSMTKMAIPNENICPGWGTATVTVSAGTTTT